MKVLHIIVCLNIGGAEIMLKRLIESNPVSPSEVGVVSLTSLGVIGESLRGRGIRVHALGMSSSWHSPIAFWRLIQIIRKYRPAVVQTWMYHADLLGGLAARLVSSCSIVWGIHSTAIPQGPMSVTYWLVRFCAIFSYFIPDKIICCANSAKTAHVKLRYAAHKMTVIPNGYDFSALEFDMTARKRVRRELGLDDGDIVIGAVGRFDPLKDFFNFVTAASHLAEKRSDVSFLMIGTGNEWSNATLRGWIEKVGLVSNFHLIGYQADITTYFSAMDMFCLSSVSEAFPNVVVEAMAIELPCIVTRVGDAADILDDDRYAVPVKNSISLADALLKICQLAPNERRNLGLRNARKVREEYGIEIIRKNYEKVYDEIAKK